MDNQGMGPETVKIRRAGTEDLPGIMRLQLQSYEPSLHEPASLFERIIGASPDTCLAAESEGVMAAYLVAHPIPDDFKNLGKGPPETCLAAEYEGVMAGYLAGAPHPR